MLIGKTDMVDEERVMHTDSLHEETIAVDCLPKNIVFIKKNLAGFLIHTLQKFQIYSWLGF
jgi:hypothetical protein